MQDPEKPVAKLMRAIALVVLRRSDPAAKWEDTASMGMDEIAGLMGTGEDPDPTSGRPPNGSP